MHKNNKFFSIEISDAEFKSTSITVEEIKKYCKEKGYEISRVHISRCFNSNLQRQDGQMKTSTKIYIIQNDDDKYSAHYFSECEIL